MTEQYGADIIRLWALGGDLREDVRIGPEIVKQQAELYRRIRNTLRWLLGALDGWRDEEALPHEALPELERFVLHRLAEQGALVARAVETHDWVGVVPSLHGFCANELSSFYFDVRKDALYCDAAASARRRATRTVLDAVCRCLVAWLAPILPFTAEDAWWARHGTGSSVHRSCFPAIPGGVARSGARRALGADPRGPPRADHRARGGTAGRLVRLVARGRDHAAARLERGRGIRRRRLGGARDRERGDGRGDAGGRAAVRRRGPSRAEWASRAEPAVAGGPEGGTGPHPGPTVGLAPGAKCARCWRVLPEVGQDHAHPALCRRCVDVVSG